MSDQPSFAFLVHPRGPLSNDLARVWTPLGHLPEGLCDNALRRFRLPPVAMARVEIGGQRVGSIVLVPFGARHLLDQPSEGRHRISRAVDKAVAMGSSLVGLGALTATVTGGGVSLRRRTDIGVTNGNAFTAAIIDTQARRLLTDAVHPACERHVAVVGATGSIGSAVSRLLARDRAVGRLTLIARPAPQLAALAAKTSALVSTLATNRMEAVAGADLVISLTASAGEVLGSEHLAPGAVVLDATQPRNTSPTLAAQRPDVLVAEGGVVDIPSLRLLGGNIGLPDGLAYACFAETALLALTGHRGHFAIGAPPLELVDHTRALASDLSHLGFTAAAPTSFGRPVTLGSHEQPGHRRRPDRGPVKRAAA